MASPPESALVVTVPEAEDAVGAHRARLDHAAALGVPAHITILYPFISPAEIKDETLAELSVLFAEQPAFGFRLSEIGWFGEEVAWLRPDPSEKFLALITAVRERYPGFVPYNDPNLEVVPHLTIGQDMPVAELRAAAESVASYLPIQSTVSSVALMTGTSQVGSWLVVESFALRAAAG